MEAYDKAAQLAQALTQTPEFIRYEDLAEKACRDEGNRKLFAEYLEAAKRYQSGEMGYGEAFDDDEADRLDELIDRVEAVPELKQAVAAKAEYESIFNQAMDMVCALTDEKAFRIVAD